jgi:hypothetical protein
VNPDQFLRVLSVDQKMHKSTIPPLGGDEPNFYWIFRNIDFEQWKSASCSRVLWLSAPRECNIHQVSSFIVDEALEKHRFVLYFFCSTANKGEQVTAFIHTLLYQIVCFSPHNEKISIVSTFLHTLVKVILKRERAPKRELMRFKDDDSSDTTIKKIFNAPTDELWDALEAVLVDNWKRELWIVIDGLDKIEHQKDEFRRKVHAFIMHLQERTPKVKALLTSRPQVEIKEVFGDLLCIEYDKERKGSIASYVLTLD